MMIVQPLQKKKLHGATGIFAMGMKAGRNYPCNVPHQYIARTEILQNIRKYSIGNGARFTVVDQEPGGAAIARRRLRDQLRR